MPEKLLWVGIDLWSRSLPVTCIASANSHHSLCLWGRPCYYYYLTPGHWEQEGQSHQCLQSWKATQPG